MSNELNFGCIQLNSMENTIAGFFPLWIQTHSGGGWNNMIVDLTYGPFL